jgi:hypothetical protein
MRVQDFDVEDIRFLRSELLFRMRVQNIVLILNAIAFFAAIVIQVEFATRPAIIGVAYIALYCILSATWCHHGARQMQIKAYLLTFERRFGMQESWESWLPRHPVRGLLGARWFISTKAPLIATAAMACVVGALLDTSPHALPATLIGACCVLGSSALLLTNPKEGLLPVGAEGSSE